MITDFVWMPRPRWVETPQQALDLLAYLSESGGGPVAVDTETNGLDREKSLVVCWSLSDGRRRYIIRAELLDYFEGFFRQHPRIIFHNANFDTAMLRNSGVDMQLANCLGRRYDTMVMHQWLNQDVSHSLGWIAEHELALWKVSYTDTFGKPIRRRGEPAQAPIIDPTRFGDESYRELVAEYSTLDAYLTYLAWVKFDAQLRLRGLDAAYYEVETRFQDSVYLMERNGVRVDHERLESYRPIYEGLISGIERKFNQDAGYPVNLDSVPQLQDFFYNRQHKQVEKLTDGGDPATNKSVLALWVKRDKDPFAKMLLEYRVLRQQNNIYVNGILQRVRHDRGGRLFTTYTMDVAATGRLCVDGETILCTDQGVRKISEIQQLLESSECRILTHKGRNRRIVGLFYKGEEDMYEVKLTNGASITCTAGHGVQAREGWQTVASLSRGSWVWSTTADVRGVAEGERGPAHSADRGLVSEGVRGRGPYQQTGGGEVPGAVFADHVPVENSASRKVRAGASLLAASAPCAGVGWEQPRFSGASRCGSGQGDAGGVGAAGKEPAGDVAPVQGQRVPGSVEHQVPRIVWCIEAAPVLAGGGLGVGRAPGLVGAGAEGCGAAVLRGPARVLPAAVRGVLSGAGAVVVRQAAGEGTRFVRGGGKGSEGPHLLEQQPVRDSVVDDASGYGCTAHSAVLPGREPDGGLLLAGQRDRRGGGRRVPRAGGYEDSGPAESRNDRAGRLAADPCVEQGPRFADGSGHGSSGFTLVQVVSVTPVGRRGVWDIEVEEDHSYVAQGFVNHNSSVNPNLQNIIVNDKIPEELLKRGVSFRDVFVPAPGRIFWVGDYSQLEMCIGAHLSRDALLIETIASGKDTHSMTAARLNGFTYEAVTAAKKAHDDHDPDHDPPLDPLIEKMVKARKVAKPVNFGIFYGMGAARLAAQTGMTVEESELTILRFFKTYPGIENYILTQHRQVAIKGYVRTLLGRKRFIEGGRAHDRKTRGTAERQAANTPVQGTAADVVRMAMVKLATDRIFRENHLSMHLQVHDELVVEAPVGTDPSVFKHVAEVMSHPFDKELLVPLTVSGKIGSSWGAAK